MQGRPGQLERISLKKPQRAFLRQLEWKVEWVTVTGFKCLHQAPQVGLHGTDLVDADGRHDWREVSKRDFEAGPLMRCAALLARVGATSCPHDRSRLPAAGDA